MNLKIVLQDPKLCNGCPCWCDSMGEPEDQYHECTAGFWDKDTQEFKVGVGCLRPAKCIEDCGE